jgi:hypothetical protein
VPSFIYNGSDNEYVDSPKMSSQNVTINLTRQTLQKVRVLAARLAAAIGFVGREEAACRSARRQTMTLIDQGFHMGGLIRASRERIA